MTDIAFITKNHTNPAYEGALVGARAVAQRYGAVLHHRAPTIPDDLEQQRALLREAVASRPAAIVLLPTHADGLAREIDAIADSGIPLFLMVSEPNAGSWVSYVGSDSEQLAYVLGMHVLSSLAPTARVAIIDGHPTSITTPQRHRGFIAAIRNFPGMTLVDAVHGDYQQEPGRAAAAELLRRHQDLDALLVANDLMAMGAIEAMEQGGRWIPMASINGSPDAIAQVRRGRLVATASFNTHQFGCLIAEAACRHLRGATVPRRIVLPPEIIDANNAADWDKPYRDRPLPCWEAVVAAQGGSAPNP